MKYAAMEVKVDGSTKSVGDTSITVDRRSHTSSNGRTITGLLSGMDITTTGTRDRNGHLRLAADGTAVANVGPAVEVTVGVTYDADDDSARLTLVHSYLGDQKQRQFMRSGDVAPTVDGGPFDVTTATTTALPATTGIVPKEDAATTAAPAVRGSVTVPYVDANNALGITGATGELAVPATGQTARLTTPGVAGIPRLAGGEFTAFDEAGTTAAQPDLYYIETGLTDNSVGDTDDGIDQTRIYLERRVIANDITYDVVYVREVTVEVDTAFEHLHYGLWNNISGTGSNTVSNLGIGFVTALASGDGMTAVDDMPTTGDAEYKGNWVANIRNADSRGRGHILRDDGMATIKAEFGKGDITAELMGLATLEGEISGNTFSGTKVSGVQGRGLTADDDEFTGSFSGGFFGPDAVEAGGVFDYTSEDMKAGEFRGSFGGGQTKDETVD